MKWTTNYTQEISFLTAQYQILKWFSYFRHNNLILLMILKEGMSIVFKFK